jgi:hypothetical protein
MTDTPRIGDPYADAVETTINPIPYEHDAVAVKLWQLAHDTIPLTNVDVRLIPASKAIALGSSSTERS